MVAAAQWQTLHMKARDYNSGDVIYELNGTPVVSLEMLTALLKDLKSGDTPLSFKSTATRSSIPHVRD